MYFTEPDPCNPNPCENNGQCSDFNGTPTCSCEPRFTGNKCEGKQYGTFHKFEYVAKFYYLNQSYNFFGLSSWKLLGCKSLGNFMERPVSLGKYQPAMWSSLTDHAS